MTPEQLDKAYTATLKDLQSNNIMASVGVSGLSLLRDRIQKTGIDAKGNKFKAYSTKDMLIGKSSFPKKSVQIEVFGSKEKRKNLEWVTLGGNRFAQFLEVSAGGDNGLKRLAVLKGGYKKWRELMGAQTDHVDFSVSNNMWNDINLISSNADHQKGIAIIGAKQDIEKKKLAGNTKRKGDILDLSKKEIDELMLLYNLRTLNVFKENGL